MYNITKCTNESCPFKGNCLRVTQADNPYNQAFRLFSPDRFGCAYFVPSLPGMTPAVAPKEKKKGKMTYKNQRTEKV